jgi:hypothetical protein
MFVTSLESQIPGIFKVMHVQEIPRIFKDMHVPGNSRNFQGHDVSGNSRTFKAMHVSGNSRTDGMTRMKKMSVFYVKKISENTQARRIQGLSNTSL